MSLKLWLTVKCKMKIQKLFLLSILIVLFKVCDAEPLVHSMAKDSDRSEQLNKVTESYKNYQELSGYVSGVSTTSKGISEATGLIGDLTKSPHFKIGSVVAKGVGWGAEKWSDGLKAAAVSDVHNFIVDDMSNHQTDYVDKNNDKISRRFKEIYQKNSEVHKELFETDPKLASQVSVLQNQKISEVLTDGIDVIRDDLINQSAEISSSIGEEVDLLKREHSIATTKIVTHIVKSLKNQNTLLENTRQLAKTQQRMSDRLESGQTNILFQGEKILFKASSAAASGNFLVINEFNKLSASQKLLVLNDDNDDSKWQERLKAAGLDTASLEQAKDAASSQKLKQNIVNTTNNIVSGVDSFQKLAVGLGWSIAEKKEFKDTVKYGNALAGAVTGFMTGNPMGAINALVGGVFGGGSGPSAGELKILAKLEEMDIKLDELKVGQEAILNQLNDSTKRLLEVNNSILIRTDKILKELDFLKEQIANLLFAIEAYSDIPERLNLCEKLKSNVAHYTSFKKFQSDFEIHDKTYSECQKVIDKFIPVANREVEQRIHPYFNVAFANEINTVGEVTSSLERVRTDFRPLLDVLWGIYGLPSDKAKWEINDNKSAAKLISALASPSRDFTHLRTKSHSFENDSEVVLNAIKQFGFSSNINNVFLDLLDVNRIQEIINYFIFVTPLKPLIDPRDLDNPKLLKVSDLSFSEFYQNELVNQYNFALQAINVAIAQQTLLSGDLLIPRLDSIIFSPVNSELRDKLLVTLSRNTTLSNNLLLYSVTNSLSTKRKLAPVKYKNIEDCPAQIEQTDIKELYKCNLQYYQQLICFNYLQRGNNRTCHKNSSNFSWKNVLPENWEVLNDNLILKSSDNKSISLTLPTAASLKNYKLELLPTLDTLLQLREKLVINADLFNMEKKLSWKTKQLWRFSEDDFNFFE